MPKMSINVECEAVANRLVTEEKACDGVVEVLMGIAGIAKGDTQVTIRVSDRV
jgi:hypothetical protein